MEGMERGGGVEVDEVQKTTDDKGEETEDSRRRKKDTRQQTAQAKI
jgi:hypothetical protein